MAIIACPECQGKVSDQAETCPHCGFKPSSFRVPLPDAAAAPKGSPWKWILGLLVGAAVLYFAATNWVRNKPDTHFVYEDIVRREMPGGQGTFSKVTVYKNGYVCGQVDGQQRFGPYSIARDFIVLPTKVVIIGNGTRETAERLEGFRSNCAH